MEETYETIDLQEIFLTIKNKIVLIVVATILAAIIGAVFTIFFITPQYEATATMIVNTRADQNATVTNDQITSARNLVSTYSIIIKSDTVLQQVIEDLQMEISYEELYNRITVTALDSTQVMKVAVRDPDPQWAKAIAAQIVKIAPDIIQDKVEAGSVKVISEARVGDSPVSPSKTRNVALAAIIGLVCSVGFVVLKELLDNTFKSEDDIQNKLDLPVLGIIPEIGGKK